mmetsp:Transcript_42099/g.110915  ORF Transcript_42099/g.110915 Transcript_42099/m.110915 type:complete len:113 (+) Transcript_42099:761-1099(+)
MNPSGSQRRSAKNDQRQRSVLRLCRWQAAVEGSRALRSTVLRSRALRGRELRLRAPGKGVSRLPAPASRPLRFLAVQGSVLRFRALRRPARGVEFNGVDRSERLLSFLLFGI